MLGNTVWRLHTCIVFWYGRFIWAPVSSSLFMFVELCFLPLHTQLSTLISGFIWVYMCVSLLPFPFAESTSSCSSDSLALVHPNLEVFLLCVRTQHLLGLMIYFARVLSVLVAAFLFGCWDFLVLVCLAFPDPLAPEQVLVSTKLWTLPLCALLSESLSVTSPSSVQTPQELKMIYYKHDASLQFVCCFFLTSLLEYNCFTMVC